MGLGSYWNREGGIMYPMEKKGTQQIEKGTKKQSTIRSINPQFSGVPIFLKSLLVRGVQVTFILGFHTHGVNRLYSYLSK